MSTGGKPRVRASPPDPDPAYFGSDPGSSLVVLLDFDGVLHPTGSEATRFSTAPRLLSALVSLKKRGARPTIALSTSWRFHPTDEVRGELDRAAPGLGALLEGRCGSHAPGKGRRRAEIADYMARRPWAQPAAFAALDDQSALFGREPPPWLILCDPTTGFGAEQDHALARLAFPTASPNGPSRPR